MASPLPPVAAPNPFANPNAALRQFNDYFANLRRTQGEAAIRAAGFTPRDLSALQAPLLRLVNDPNATPAMRQQAYQQARDALAQRLTTQYITPQPVVPQPMTPQPAMPPETVVTGTPRPMQTPPQPAVPAGAPGLLSGIMTPSAPPPTNPLADFIAKMNAPKPPATGMLTPVGPAPTPPMALPGGTGYDERGNMLTGATQPSLRDILARGIGAGPASGAPVASPPTAGGMMGLLGGMPSTPNETVVTGTPRPQVVPPTPEMPIIPTPMPQPVAPPPPPLPPLPGMYRGGFAVRR